MFPFSPKLVIIMQASGTSWRMLSFFASEGNRYLTCCFGQGQSGECSHYEDSEYSLSSNRLQWHDRYSNGQLNEKSSVYRYIALG